MTGLRWLPGRICVLTVRSYMKDFWVLTFSYQCNYFCAKNRQNDVYHVSSFAGLAKVAEKADQRVMSY